MTHRLIKLVLASALVLMPALALAETPAEQFVRDKQSELVGHAKQKADAKVDAVFDEILDYDVLAEESLGSNWAKLADDQKAQFRCVLRQLVVTSYRRNLQKTLNYEVTIQGADQVTKGTLVKTTAKSRKNNREEAVSVAYLLHQTGGRWKIRDIVTEGSSLVGNYRSQFQRLIEKKGFDELLRRMKDKAGAGAAKC